MKQHFRKPNHFVPSPIPKIDNWGCPFIACPSQHHPASASFGDGAGAAGANLAAAPAQSAAVPIHCRRVILVVMGNSFPIALSKAFRFRAGGSRSRWWAVAACAAANT
jgi:hypothetical protein